MNNVTSINPNSLPSIWQIRIAIASLCCLLIGALTFAILFLTSQIDKQQAKQSQVTFTALEATWVELHRLTIEDYAYWTPAFEAIIAGDDESKYELIGAAAVESELIDWIFLTDSEGDVLNIYGPDDGSNPDPEFEKGSIAEYVNNLKGIDLSERTVLGYVDWYGGLAFVAAAPVTPSTLVTGTNDGYPLMFAVWEYTAEFLEEVEALSEISNLRIENSDASEHSMQVFSPDKRSTHWFAWNPATPGTDLARGLVREILVFSILVVLLSALSLMFFERLQNGLRKATAELDTIGNAFENQRQFSENAAHELKTPLQVLMAGLDEFGSSPRVGELQNDVLRMGDLVNQLLALSRLDVGIDKTNEKVDLCDVATKTLSGLAPIVVRRGLSLDFAASQEQIVVIGNSILIGDLIKILAENAINVSPSDGVIEVKISKAGILTVKDSGPGIPLEHRERVFDRFWRAEETKYDGSGLGLAIAKQIAQVCNAEITLQPGEQEEGACFAVAFKVAKPVGENVD